MMGGVMLDRRTREELSGVLSLGLLSERMVLALGRAMNGNDLTEDDLDAIAAARRLFERMTEEDVIVIEGPEDRMLNDESYLDALHVVQLQTGGAEIEPAVRRYVDLLEKLINDQISEEQREELTSLRDLFVEVGEMTLSRANELSRTRQDPSWRPMRLATLRF
jgi:hypothetical protein